MKNILLAKYINEFKHALVVNPQYEEMTQQKNKKINNTTCIIVWYHPVEEKFYYLIQKRGLKMGSGAGLLAVGGGMLEDRDKNLQIGAVREIMEESQVLFKGNLINTMTKKTMEQISKYLFYLSEDSCNVTYYLILVSKKMPKWSGPILKDKYPFKDSKHEIDMIDDNWGWKKLKDRIYKGHCFMTSEEIKQIMKIEKSPKMWKYSKSSLFKLFKLLE